MEVRDPIHGPIAVDDAEKAVLDHPFVQRLRQIRATGFSYLPFPGATHTRYAHSVGVLHLAGRAFDVATAPLALDPERRATWRAVVRIAALCHDLGHAPFSHSTEFAMPPLRSLGLSWYGTASNAERPATHEDYTIAILAHTSLAGTIAAHFPFTARHVAALIHHDVAPPDDLFMAGGLDHRRILSQIISSEIDVDRMDYLVRDSYFTGARYGQVDVPWLLTSLAPHTDGGEVSLALDFSALYAFDDFLVARHHMFLMVYFHHKSVVYEEILKRYVAGCDWAIPSDLDDYLLFDDVALESRLRTSNDPWARRIVHHDPYRRVLEVHGTPEEVDLTAQRDRLADAGIDAILAGSTGKLSRYNVVGQKRERAPAIFVRESFPAPPGPARTLTELSGVLQRYAETRRIARIYVPPEDVERARGVLGARPT